MKNLIFFFLLILSFTLSAQPRKGVALVSQTDTNAWKSEIRFGNIRGNIAAQTNLQNALNAKENNITGGTTSQYWRGDKSFQTLDKSAVGLPNVLNVTQEPAITAGTNNQYWRGDKTWQTLNPAAVQLGSVLNVAQEPAISAGTTAQYWRGDKSWQTLNAASVGLQNVLNIAQEPAITAGTTNQFWRGDKSWQTLNGAAVGLGNVLNLAQEPAISSGTTAQFWRGDKTWQPISSITGNYFLKYAGQVRQYNITESGFYAGLASVENETLYNENHNTVAFVNSSWGTGLQLQSNVFNDYYFVRRMYNNVWQPWKRLALTSDMDTANTRITNYINTQVSNVEGQLPTTFSYTISNLAGDVTYIDYNIHKYGPVVCMNVQFTKTNATANATFIKLFDIPVAARPTQKVFGAMNSINGLEGQHGTIGVQTNGDVVVSLGIGSRTWFANLTWIQFIN